VAHFAKNHQVRTSLPFRTYFPSQDTGTVVVRYRTLNYPYTFHFSLFLCNCIVYRYSQGFGSALISCGSGSFIFSNCGSGSRVLMTKNFTAEIFFSSKISIYLSLSLQKGRPSYRRSLQFPKENILHFKHGISLLFLFLWVIFALLYPDPATQINPDSKPWFRV
jgi:hypothetical protein